MDVHIHLDPMGLGPRGASSIEAMAENIVSFMDRMGVEKAILMPPPQVPGQQIGRSTYAACLSAAEYYPQRLYIGAGGGVLNPMIYKYKKEEVTEEVREKFREEAEKLIRAGIVAFGEMTALHLSLQEHHIFAQVASDHPLFLLLADIAAENNIPIDLHMEAVTADMPTPQSLLNASSQNPAALKANIQALERLLTHNRKAKIVWQHIGWDNIGCMTTELLSGLLKQHPNLYIALRVEYRRMKVDESGPMSNRVVDDNWGVRPEWARFITDFAERIVIGSDEFMGIRRQRSRPKDSFKETWGILMQLPEDVAQKIGRDNAVRIYNLR